MGESLSARDTKATGSNCGRLIWCCAIFQSDGLDVMQFDIEGVSLSRFVSRFVFSLGATICIFLRNISQLFNGLKQVSKERM